MLKYEIYRIFNKQEMEVEKFGEKVRLLREEKGISREEFCGDETELSVRQLARIELSQSVPNLSKASFIANQLGVKLGVLTDGDSLELPKRYKELKYLILRTPTYKDEKRLLLKDSYFDEIYADFYDNLPEEEQLVVECMRSKADVFLTDNSHLATKLLKDYFYQIKTKRRYSINDLIIIDLYMVCANASNYTYSMFNQDEFKDIADNLLKQEKFFSLEEIFVLNNTLFNSLSLLLDLEMWDEIDNTFLVLKGIMAKIQDYHKKPILNMIEWKYILKSKGEVERARKLYEEAVLYAHLIDDTYLAHKITEEWENDAT